MDLSNDPSQSKELQHVEIQKMVVDICMFFFAEILFLFFSTQNEIVFVVAT